MTAGRAGGVGGEVRQLVTLTQAAELGPYSRPRIRRLIRDGVLQEGVHYTHPHRCEPLIVRDAYLAFLEGADAALRRAARRPRRRREGRGNFSLVETA